MRVRCEVFVAVCAQKFRALANSPFRIHFWSVLRELRDEMEMRKIFMTQKYFVLLLFVCIMQSIKKETFRSHIAIVAVKNAEK